MSAQEQDEFSEWLAADPLHGELLARFRRDWRRLDKLVEWRPEHAASPNPDLLAPPSRPRWLRFVPTAVALAAAAAIAFMFKTPATPSRPASPGVAATAPDAGPLHLPDGSIVEFNDGATLTVDFTARERRVRLTGGEAHFSVAKNSDRPFIVTAGGVDIRAVGTAFNVRVDTAAVEVLVTEGRVQVEQAAEAATSSAGPRPVFAAPLVPMLTARQRAIIPIKREPELPQVATLSLREIDRVLAWQHRLLEFDATPLAEVVAQFNRRNVIQLQVMDPELAATRISGSFRTDNIEGLMTLMQQAFGVTAERRSDTEIILHRR